MASEKRISKTAASVYDRTFFTRDRSFYGTLIHLMGVIVLQNVITYSVNMADNLMLGAYSQTALSGVATANMVFFLFNSVVTQLGEGAVVIGSQYWSQKILKPIRKIFWTAAKTTFILGIIVFLVLLIIPRPVISIFSTDAAVIEQGVEYINVLKYTYPIYAISVVLMAAIRITGQVNITLYVSIISLVLNVVFNYVFIFGKFGAPELGAAGAAVATLIARVVELIILLAYMIFKDKKLRLFKESPLNSDRQLTKDYLKNAVPLAVSAFIWSLATPIQTGILGHLDSDAIAANSASTTLYQYLKVVTQGEASASIVITGRTVGEGDMSKIHSYTRTLQVIYLGIGIVLSVALYFLRIPYLSLYDLTPEAMEMADNLLILLCFIMLGMAYQMPTGTGVIKGGGDSRFILILNTISSWVIVIPLGFLAAFLWDWSVVAIVAVLNADQVFKCIPVFIRTQSYRWVHDLTRKEHRQEV